MPILQAQRMSSSAFYPCTIRHDNFPQRHVLITQRTGVFALTGIIEFERTNEFVHRVRRRINNQHITFANFDIPGLARLAFPAAYQADNSDIVFIGYFIKVSHALTDSWGLFGHMELCNVAADIKQFLCRIVADTAFRQQSPPYQCDKQDTDHSACQSNRCEVEHAKTLTHRTLTKLSKDDVGWCTDQRDHAAKDR